ncbi:hypothetical protein ACUH91_00460 [Dermabacteraceae bacterium P9123]
MANSSKPKHLKKIFVISPIGKLDADGVDFPDIVLKEIIIPAARDAEGYAEPLRIDKFNYPGSIDAQIVSQIIDSDVCIADLTGLNPNVMYEVAIAHAADKPVLLLQQSPGLPPFDFASERMIRYSTRVDEANRAREELTQQLKNISSASELTESGVTRSALNPVRRAFAELKRSSDNTPLASVENSEILDRIKDLESLLVRSSFVSEPPIRDGGLFLEGPMRRDFRKRSFDTALRLRRLGKAALRTGCDGSTYEKVMRVSREIEGGLPVEVLDFINLRIDDELGAIPRSAELWTPKDVEKFEVFVNRIYNFLIKT